MQWDGSVEDASVIIDWVTSYGGTARHLPPGPRADGGTWPGCIAVDTLDATARVFRYDYMMRGTVGEFYPCQADVFASSYEEAATPPQPDPPAWPVCSGCTIPYVLRRAFSTAGPSRWVWMADCQNKTCSRKHEAVIYDAEGPVS